jgi:heat shock protein HspQ
MKFNREALMDNNILFSIGQLVTHQLFHYRGVVIDVDPYFMLSDQWYDIVAKSRPPKDQPWYRVLVHNASHQTYVAQRNLIPDSSDEPINHPEVNEYFSDFSKGKYVLGAKIN